MVEKGYWTVKEIAEYLDCADATIYNLIQKGELKAITIAGTYRVKKEDFEQYLKDCEYKAK